MKKLLIRTAFFAFMILLLPGVCKAARAKVYELDAALEAAIREYGVFDGKSGIFYASAERFEGASALFTAFFSDGEIGFAVFDCHDGLQTADKLSFPVGGKNTYTLSLTSAGTETAVVLTTNKTDETFVLRCDSFVKTENPPSGKIRLAVCKNGRLTLPREPNVYVLMKRLRAARIADSKYYNAVNDAGAETRREITELLSSCADVMRFDANAPDIDALMISVMNTHSNFTVPPKIKAQTLDGGAVGAVSAEFIDYIIGNVFGCTPPTPLPNELARRGFCCYNGRYYYKKPYNVPFSTEILDITALYELGGGVYYAAFSDVYHRGSEEVEEYSFAVVDMSEGGGGRVLRLGMGETPLSDAEIASYAPGR